jgi:hypothetical protein
MLLLLRSGVDVDRNDLQLITRCYLCDGKWGRLRGTQGFSVLA